jgi:hypothetical protein
MAAAISPVSAADGKVDALRLAIEDLARTFPESYARAPEWLGRLNVASNDAAFAALQREALLANPLVSSQPILFVTRPPFPFDHHATETMAQCGEISEKNFVSGGALKALEIDPRTGAAAVRTLMEAGLGCIRDPDVSFDGRTILISFRRDAKDDYHIYELHRDGSGLRQLTFGPGLADIDPLYLPGGQIAFSSTRDVKYCQCNRHISPNLFRMESDGANPVQIGVNDLPELRASVMPDGRLLYERWEYVDRQFGPSYGLWTANPDGTAHALYYGNNSWVPGAIMYARAIPGTEQVVCIFGSCHDSPWGALAIIDRRIGSDGAAPVVKIWPSGAIRFLKNVDDAAWTPEKIDILRGVTPKYVNPWPLSDERGRGAGKYFLCSRQAAGALLPDGSPAPDSARVALFLVDVFGNELLFHDEAPGCFDPMPVAARGKPPVIPERVDYRKSEGYFYVQDVYRGTGMERVPRGSIKYLRIVEAPPKRAWTHPGYGIDASQAPAMNWNLTVNKAIVGDVPVEDDGSAYFSVPAGRFVYFQALDSEKRMIQSMRSGTSVMPGETAGCTGCHDYRSSAKPQGGFAALRRTPNRPREWFGPMRDFNYLTEVQPVLDRHCVKCHDCGKDAGGKLNLSGDVGMVFNTSYVDLMTRSPVRWSRAAPDAPKPLVRAVHDGPPAVLPPYSWGSLQSKLGDVVYASHNDIRLTPEDRQRITTWIDLNAPYYGAYWSVFENNRYGRAPLTDAQYNRLVELTGSPKVSPISGQSFTEVGMVNFARPELSPILASLQDVNDPRRAEALALIRSGAETLASQPREDQLGAAAAPRTPKDLERQARRTRCEEWERSARDAILRGARFYPARVFTNSSSSSSSYSNKAAGFDYEDERRGRVR